MSTSPSISPSADRTLLAQPPHLNPATANLISSVCGAQPMKKTTVSNNTTDEIRTRNMFWLHERWLHERRCKEAEGETSNVKSAVFLIIFISYLNLFDKDIRLDPHQEDTLLLAVFP